MTATEAMEGIAKKIQKDIKNGDFYLEELKDRGYKCYTVRMKSFEVLPEECECGGVVSLQTSEKTGEQYLDLRGGLFPTLIYAINVISFDEEQEVREIIFKALLEKEQGEN